MRSIRLHAVRAVLAAAAAIAAVWGLLLPGASPASASPVPPGPDPALIGTWVNMNPAGSVSDIVISGNAGALMVDVFYNCSACEQGSVPATVYGTNTASTTGDSFQANFNTTQGGSAVMLGTLNPATKVLAVQEFFTLSGGVNTLGSNWVANESFVPAAPITPGAGGKPSATYPVGKPVTPDKNLVANWTIAKTVGVKEIDIAAAANPNGSLLTFHVFGQCGGQNGPALCDWGQTFVDSTYGTSPTGTAQAKTFLAFYPLKGQRVVLSGTLNMDGTLTVSTYTEFIDGSGESNFVEKETFTRV